MKKMQFGILIMAAISFLAVSCDNNSDKYLSSLDGYWTYSDTVTTHRSYALDIDGANATLYGAVEEDGKLSNDTVQGILTYSSKTGVGNILFADGTDTQDAIVNSLKNNKTQIKLTMVVGSEKYSAVLNRTLKK